MRFTLFLWCILAFGCANSPGDDDTHLNGIQLGAPRSEYIHEFHYYTGDEPFYQDYPTIKASLMNNIANGIREGVYEGQSRLKFGNWRAQRLSLVFYQERLHKAQWSFKAYQGSDIPAVAKGLNNRFTETYGVSSIEEFPDFTIRIWEQKPYRLQTFQEGDLEFTVEWRDFRLLDDQ